MDEFKYYNHLGFHNPFFTQKSTQFHISDDILPLLNEEQNNNLDFASIVEVLNKGYIFGDRTLIKGIYRTPWMAKPEYNTNTWQYFNVPLHDEKLIAEELLAKEFYSLIKIELYNYIKNHKSIGILLTGGMDSRIVACALHDLIQNDKLIDKTVTAFTWGNPKSRDVIYAQQISSLFKWNWELVEVNEEQIFENIQITIDSGCEFSPLHLHGISKIADMKSVDCVLAGSFGDSIGRGEYSGSKVLNLNSLDSNINNFAGILRDDFHKLVGQDIKNDLSKYHNLFPTKKQYQSFEQDQQIHYMRRMLNPCLSIINRKIPLYQLFSSPEVFGYIWSIHPDLRNDNIYKNILIQNNIKLLEIPWARTGITFPFRKGKPDQLSKSHHDYGNMLRKNFLSFIDEQIDNSSLSDLNIFNYTSIKRLLKFCRQKPIESSFFYEEKLLWLAAFAKFVSKNEINSEVEKKKSLIKGTMINIIDYNSKYYYKKYK